MTDALLEARFKRVSDELERYGDNAFDFRAQVFGNIYGESAPKRPGELYRPRQSQPFKYVIQPSWFDQKNLTIDGNPTLELREFDLAPSQTLWAIAKVEWQYLTGVAQRLVGLDVETFTVWYKTGAYSALDYYVRVMPLGQTSPEQSLPQAPNITETSPVVTTDYWPFLLANTAADGSISDTAEWNLGVREVMQVHLIL